MGSLYLNLFLNGLGILIVKDFKWSMLDIKTDLASSADAYALASCSLEKTMLEVDANFPKWSSSQKYP